MLPDFITEKLLAETHMDFVKCHAYTDLEDVGFIGGVKSVTSTEKQLNFVEGIDENPSNPKDFEKRVRKATKNQGIVNSIGPDMIDKVRKEGIDLYVMDVNLANKESND